MIKNNKFLLFFSFVVLIAFQPLSGHAAECTPEQIEDGRKALQKDCADKFQAFNKALDAYNAEARQYANQCGGLEQKVDQGMKDLTIGGEDGATDSPITNQSYHSTIDSKLQYTGVIWSSFVGKDADCQNRRINAAVKKNDVDKAFNNFRRSSDVLDPSTQVQCVCADGNVGNQVCQSSSKSNEEEEKNENDCLSFQSYLHNFTKCPFCKIFEVILQADNAIAETAWNGVTGPMTMVVSAFFAVFLLLEALKFASNMSGSSTSGFLKSVLILGTKIAITLLLLSSSGPIYDYFINPVVSSGLDMGTSLAQEIGSSKNVQPTYVGSFGSGPLNANLLKKVLNTVETFNSSAATMPAIGEGLMCNGWNNGGSWLPDLEMWFEGLVVFVFGIIIWLAISFYLIDCTAQLGITCALLPIFIACWPFKQTQRYTGIGAKMIMNIFFDFVMMGVVLIIGAELVVAALGEYTLMETAIDTGNIKILKQMVEVQGKGILILIACSFFALKLLGKSGSLASMFSGGAGSKIGATMGGAIASGATAMAVGAARTGAKAGGAGAKFLGDKLAGTEAGQKVIGSFNSAAGSLRAAKSSFGEMLTGKSQQKGSGLPQTPPPPGSGSNNTTQADNQPQNSAVSPKAGERSGAEQGIGKNPSNQADDQTQSSVVSPSPKDGNRSRVVQSPKTTPTDANTVSGAIPTANTGTAMGERPNSNRTVDKNGNITERDYFANGQISSERVTSADGTQQYKTYDEKGRIKTEGMLKDDKPVLTREYHDNGQLKSERKENADHSTSFVTYDRNGNKNHEYSRDAEGNQVSRDWHENGQLKSEQKDNADGSSSTTTYYETGVKQHESQKDKSGEGTYVHYNTDGSIETSGKINGQNSKTT